MMNHNILQTQKSGRYFSLGKASNNIESIWIVIHGYGQLADEFLKNFEIFASPKRLIIAPEALNKFYFRGFNGKIGASWMTKEDRENEINDYVNFISSVYYNEVNKIDSKIENINVLGFSQGTHTAVRWLDKARINIANLILWSGGLPRDCNYESEYWLKTKIKFVFGLKDKFIDKKLLNKHEEYVSNYKMNVESIKFNGGHELNEQILGKLFNDS